MTLDQATAGLLAQIEARGGKPFHEMSVAEARGLTQQMVGILDSGPEMAKVTDGRVAVPGGFVRYRLLQPDAEPRGIIVYFHGGGWVLGEIEGSEPIGRTLADRTDCTVMLVDYRKAPEYRFPTAVADCYAALRWASEHTDRLAGRPVPIIVAGDSAGGTLSAVLAHWARNKGAPELALQVLVYPVVDCDLEADAYKVRENQLILTRESISWFWDHYAPDATSREHPDASPLRSPDFTNLPPAVLVTAEHDILRAEGEMYATYLLKAGVAVETLCVPGQMHGFFPMVNLLPGSEVGINFVVEAVKSRLSTLSS